MTDTIAAARPAEPFADLKARAAAAIEDARDEILDLSHRIHANPEPAFEERQAAAWVAEAIARHGYAVEQPVGQPRNRRARPAHRRPRRRTARGSGSSPSTTRCLAWATAAATTRWRRPGSARRSPWRRSRRPARRDRVPRHARGGAGLRQAMMIDDGAVRRARRRAPVPPLRPGSCRDARRSPREDVDVTFTGFGGPRRRGSVERPERARRDDRAVRLVGLWRQQLPTRLRASTGSSRKAAPPRTSSRTARGPVHDPQRRPGATTRS